MRHLLPRWPLPVAGLALLLTACGPSHPPAETATISPPALFDRLGGYVGIAAIMDDFVGRAVTDDRIAPYFRNINMSHMKSGMREFLCAETGGPCRYTGKPMREAHAGLGVTDAAFDAMLDDLRKTLNKTIIPIADRELVVLALSGQRGEVVQPGPLPKAEASAAPATRDKPATHDKKAKKKKKKAASQPATARIKPAHLSKSGSKVPAPVDSKLTTTRDTPISR